MFSKKCFVTICIVILTALLATGCLFTTPVAVTGVTLNKATMALTAGEATGTLVATVAPTDATNKSVTWSSSAPAMVTVSVNGVVTPLTVGTATITVTTVDGGLTATCVVTVTPTPEVVPPGPAPVAVDPVDITAATVVITAPVLGVTPENAVTIEGSTNDADFTVTSVTWNEALTAGGKFAAAQAYTATIVLTSKNAKEFQAAAFTPTVAGSASIGTTVTSAPGVGNTVTFTVTYAATGALAVSSIAVTTQPTKLSYTETTDDVLALDGMVVTATNNDGSTTASTFTDGTAAGYTASPANGATLTTAANNGNSVTITHTASSQTATTSNLNVAATPNLVLTPANQSVSIGAQATVNIGVENVTDLLAANIDLTFDPAILQYVPGSAASGAFWLPEGTLLMQDVVTAPGTLNILIFADPLEYKSGTGTIFTVAFKRIAAGVTNICFGDTELAEPGTPPDSLITHTKGGCCSFN